MKKNIVRSLLVAGIIVFSGSGCSGYNNTANNQPRDVTSPVPAEVRVPEVEPTVEKEPTPPATESAPTPAKSPVTVTEEKPVVESRSISIQNFTFNPSTLTVKKGTKVTWTNNDSAHHQIKSSAFSSDSLSNGQSFSFTFSNVGAFDYICSIHPSMTGKIIVE